MMSIIALYAQDSSDEWYLGKPIAEIQFEGLNNITEDDLVGIIAPFIGELFDEEIFLDLQRRIYALDYFSLVIPRAESVDDSQSAVVVVFDVEENPVVDSIRFVGNADASVLELTDAILIKRDDIIDANKIRLDESSIRRVYQEKGYPDASVTTELLPSEEPGRNVVEFRIEEGSQILVRAIRFSGNQFATEATLRGIMQTKEQSLFESGSFQEELLLADQMIIEQYYGQFGYIDARVVEITRQQNRHEESNQIFLQLTVFIEEGKQYQFGGFVFEGNSIFGDDELLEQARALPGNLINETAVLADVQRIRDLYFEDGYIFNAIEPIQERDVESDIITYKVMITERPRAHIENIIVRGNTKTNENVITRELPFEVGEVFSATKIREGILNLLNLRYFSNVLPETPQGSAEGLMELIVNVEETNTADISFGFAIGGTDDIPVSLQLQVQERNFLGNGQTLSTSLNIASQEQSLRVSFVEPWFFQERLRLGMGIELRHELQSDTQQDILAPIFADGDPNAVPDPYTGEYVFSEDTRYNDIDYSAGSFFPGIPNQKNIEDLDLVTDYSYALSSNTRVNAGHLFDYDLWGAGVNFSAGYSIPTLAGLFSFGGSISVAFEYISYDRDLYRPFSAVLRENWRAAALINRLALNVSLNSLDIFYDPSEGYLLSQRLTFTGGFLFGDRHYIRSDTGGEIYFTLFDIPVGEVWNFKMVLGLNSQFSLILPHFLVPEPFNTMEQPVVTSADLLVLDGFFNARGWPRISNGIALWNNWLELRFPLIPRVLSFDAFLEMASFWQEYEQLDPNENNFFDSAYFTFGAGLRLAIAQFPLRIYLAKRFRVVNGVVDWQTSTTLFNEDEVDGGGLDLVLTFGSGIF